MKKEKLPIRQLLSLIIGEIIVSLAVCGIYFAIGRFSYKVISGVLLGSSVTVLNFTVLAIMTNRVLNSFLLERGNTEMSEEDALAIAMKFQGKVQNQIKLSFIIRTFVMLACLALAFLIEAFDVIATVVPLLAFRPIITLSELIAGKMKKTGDIELDPSQFSFKEFDGELPSDVDTDGTADENSAIGEASEELK